MANNRQQKIYVLFEKFLAGSISQSDLDEIYHYFDTCSDSDLQIFVKYFFDVFEDQNASSERCQVVDPVREQEISSRMRENVFSRIGHAAENPERKKSVFHSMKPIRLRIAMASIAAILLIGFGIVFFQIDDQPSTINPVMTDMLLDQDVLPGTHRATLMLGDGRIITLEEQASGIIVERDRVLYRDGGEASSLFSGADTTDFHTITTPKGGYYQIQLPDGTKVWLNAGSSLTYPAKFAFSNRLVKLTGEAYFEVAADLKRPFVVSSQGQEVKVLGTHFNIHAYTDEPYSRTTLVEGSVHVSSGKERGRQVIQLFPGQQAIVTKQGNMNVAEVDLENCIAWKSNDFDFTGKDLSEILREIARWYDVEIEYEPNAPYDIKIGGTVSRSNKLSSVLKAIASTNRVSFEFDGKTVFVKN